MDKPEHATITTTIAVTPIRVPSAPRDLGHCDRAIDDFDAFYGVEMERPADWLAFDGQSL